MTIKEAMYARHSVRNYENKEIPIEIISALKEQIDECNKEAGMHIQLVTNEPKAFDGRMAHYGKFSGVQNYIALIGKKGSDLEEKCGYYGEKLVLLAQQLGLNTCWVAMTFSKIKSAYTVNAGEKLCIVISLGYGMTQGVAHKSKSMKELCKVAGEVPKWFQNGMELAVLAPTAMDQQKFTISLDGNKVSAKAGMAFYSKLDLGIVKYHFEIGAGKENFKWA
jgi:hypothetical protein